MKLSPIFGIINIDMFGEDIHLDIFVEHKWREDITCIGVISLDFLEEISDRIIISIGQVVPHEVAAMSKL